MNLPKKIGIMGILYVSLVDPISRLLSSMEHIDYSLVGFYYHTVDSHNITNDIPSVYFDVKLLDKYSLGVLGIPRIPSVKESSSVLKLTLNELLDYIGTTQLRFHPLIFETPDIHQDEIFQKTIDTVILDFFSLHQNHPRNILYRLFSDDSMLDYGSMIQDKVLSLLTAQGFKVHFTDSIILQSKRTQLDTLYDLFRSHLLHLVSKIIEEMFLSPKFFQLVEHRLSHLNTKHHLSLHQKALVDLNDIIREISPTGVKHKRSLPILNLNRLITDVNQLQNNLVHRPILDPMSYPILVTTDETSGELISTLVLKSGQRVILPSRGYHLENWTTDQLKEILYFLESITSPEFDQLRSDIIKKIVNT